MMKIVSSRKEQSPKAELAKLSWRRGMMVARSSTDRIIWQIRTDFEPCSWISLILYSSYCHSREINVETPKSDYLVLWRVVVRRRSIADGAVAAGPLNVLVSTTRVPTGLTRRQL